jgi:hypothetical protein
MANIGQTRYEKGSATAIGPNMNPPPYSEGKPAIKGYGPGKDGALGHTAHNGTIDKAIDAQVSKVGKDVYGW